MGLWAVTVLLEKRGQTNFQWLINKHLLQDKGDTLEQNKAKLGAEYKISCLA